MLISVCHICKGLQRDRLLHHLGHNNESTLTGKHLTVAIAALYGLSGSLIRILHLGKYPWKAVIHVTTAKKGRVVSFFFSSVQRLALSLIL